MHVQRMRGISTPRTRAESDIAECSDAPLPPPFFYSTTSPGAGSGIRTFRSTPLATFVSLLRLLSLDE